MLCESFLKTLKDPELLAEAKKGRMDVEYTSDDDLEALVKEVLDQPAEVIEQAKDSRKLSLRFVGIIAN
jgi:tripartite-type tricarboxylate transporter receptor subunit TctC